MTDFSAMSGETAPLPATPSTILRHTTLEPVHTALPKAQAAEPADAGTRDTPRPGKNIIEIREDPGAPLCTIRTQLVPIEEVRKTSLLYDLDESKARRGRLAANVAYRPPLDGSCTAIPVSSTSSYTGVAVRKAARNNHAEGDPAVELTPAPYVSLLPATLELRKVRGNQLNMIMGLAANEMFAARDVRRSTGIVQPIRAKMHSITSLGMCGFETRLRHLQDCAKVNRRLWRKYNPSVGKLHDKQPPERGVSCEFYCNTDPTDFYDTINTAGEGGDNKRSDSSEASMDGSSGKGGLTKNSQIRAVAVARREYMDLASHAQKKEQATTLLRATLKQSAKEVAHARHGHTMAKNTVALPITQYKESGRTGWAAGEDEVTEGDEKTDTESISWGTDMTKPDLQEKEKREEGEEEEEEEEEREQKEGEEQTTSQQNIAQDRNVDSMEDSAAVPSQLPHDRCRSAELRNILNRGKTSMVYGLELLHSNHSAKSRPTVSLPAIPLLGRGTSTEAPKRNNRSSSTACSRMGACQKRQPLPVEYGVGERSRCLLESQVVQHRTNEIEHELQRSENIRRTRELMRKLMPERVRLLDESLAHSYDSPSSVLEKHRQFIYDIAMEMETVERRSACAAYIDALQEWYGKDIPESASSSVKKALQQAREAIMQNPPRCNSRVFLAIVKSCFEMTHLAENSVQDILRRLSLLFEMSTTEYRDAIDMTYRQLNNPKGYEARFREIDRTIVGKTVEGETRVRVILHRCRFLPTPVSGENSGSEAMGYDTGVAVRLQTDQSAFTSDRARVKIWKAAASPSGTMNGKRTISGTAMCGIANLRAQVFRLQMTERLSLDVELLMNGTTIGTAEVRMSQFVSNKKGKGTFWLRTSGEKCPLAEVKLTLEVLSDKDRRRRTLSRTTL